VIGGMMIFKKWPLIGAARLVLILGFSIGSNYSNALEYISVKQNLKNLSLQELPLDSEGRVDQSQILAQIAGSEFKFEAYLDSSNLTLVTKLKNQIGFGQDQASQKTLTELLKELSFDWQTVDVNQMIGSIVRESLTLNRADTMAIALRVALYVDQSRMFDEQLALIERALENCDRSSVTCKESTVLGLENNLADWDYAFSQAQSNLDYAQIELGLATTVDRGWIDRVENVFALLYQTSREALYDPNASGRRGGGDSELDRDQ